MRRRTLLSLVGAGTLSLAGCTTATDTEDAGGSPDVGTTTPGTEGGATAETDATNAGGTRTGLPADCPTSQGLDVDWPEALDASAVAAFVEAYERAYFREVIVEYEPESRLDSYELGVELTDGPTPLGDGWVLEYSGGGGIYRPALRLDATTVVPPDGAEPVPASEIESGTVVDLVEEAAETGAAEHHVETAGETVDRYVDLLASLSADFDGLSRRGDSSSLYVYVDGTTVELSATASDFHGDYWWDATYYVDERVVRRTGDDDADPQNGTLLECRRPG